MFQIKSFDSILASMINRITAMSDDLTDFNTGSKTRTILEAVASEIDQYYQSLLKGLYEAVPVAVYKTFTFERLPAVASSGYVTFTRKEGSTGDIAIPAGTRVKIPNTNFVYETGTQATILNNQNTVDVYVTCQSTGVTTNCLANTITEIVDTIDNVASVNNASGYVNGRNEETDSQRKLRFQQWLNTLARSTHDSVQYGASLVKIKNEAGLITEEVKKVIVHEPCIDDNPPGPVGYIDVYLWNGVDGASQTLIAETKKSLLGYINTLGQKISGWKAAGIILEVYPVSLDVIPVTAAITLKTGYDQDAVNEALLQVIDTYFQRLEIGETLIWGQLYENMMAVTGVKDIDLTAPAANAETTSWNYINVKGTVTLSYA